MGVVGVRVWADESMRRAIPAETERPLVSVIICTRDRVQRLAATLQSFHNLVIPEDISAELVVVDNGSSDGTAEYVNSVRIPNLPLRLVHEQTAGLSHARNAAIKHSVGSVLLWTDDDVLLEPYWLVRMVRPILAGEADATAGTVIIPPDLKERLRGTVLERRQAWLASTEDMDMAAPGRMVGANMAFGRHVLAKIPEFDVHLGAGPNSLGFYEDTLFAWQLINAGFRLVGVADAVAHHHFAIDRLSAQSIIQMAGKMGRSLAYVQWHWNQDSRRLPLLMSWRIRVSSAIKLLRATPAQAADIRVREESKVAFYEEYRKCRATPRKYRGEKNRLPQSGS